MHRYGRNYEVRCENPFEGIDHSHRLVRAIYRIVIFIILYCRV